jgi:hypothetical protein
MTSSGFRSSLKAKDKSSNLHSRVARNGTFFAPLQIPTLKQMASIELVRQLSSVENVEEFITLSTDKANEEKFKQFRQKFKNINDIAEAFGISPSLYDEVKIILAKIKKLHYEAIEENNVEEVDAFLNATPTYLLPLLLQTTGRVVTSAKGLEAHVIVEGPVLSMAFGAEAFGRDGSDLCLMPDNSCVEYTNLKKLSLYHDSECTTHFRYMIQGREWTIERGRDGQYGQDDLEKLRPVHFDRLKKMFKNPYLHNKNLNLDHFALNEAQRDAYSALLEITWQREHTKKRNEDGMVEILQRHIRRALPNNGEGELEIAKQTCKQLTKEWHIEEEKRHAEDLKALHKVRQAISDSVSSADLELVAALQEYRSYLEPKGIIKTGNHWNAKLYLAALKMGHDEFFKDYRKDDLFYNQVVGYISRFAPKHVKQGMAQGFIGTILDGKKSNRSLEYNYVGGSFHLAASSNIGIGFDSWVDCCFGGPRYDVGGWWGPEDGRWQGWNVYQHHGQKLVNHALVSFSRYVEDKTKVMLDFMPPPDERHSKNGCIFQ